MNLISQNNVLNGTFTEYKETLLNGNDGSTYTFNEKPFPPTLQMTFNSDSNTVLIYNDGSESKQFYSIDHNILITKLVFKGQNGMDTIFAVYKFELKKEQLILKEYKKGLDEKHYLKAYHFKKGGEKSELAKTALPSEMFVMANEKPSFPGGLEALKQFVEKELELPNTKDRKNKIRIFLRLTIDETGTILNTEYIGSPPLEFALAAMKLVRKMPTWIPAKQNGKNVAFYYTFPVIFN